MGPKTQNKHELPFAVVEKSSVIATDSLPQAWQYDPPFFLHGTSHLDRMIELGDIITGKVLLLPHTTFLFSRFLRIYQKAGRTVEEDITLFCSVGLAGTEVVLASSVLDSMLG